MYMDIPPKKFKSTRYLNLFLKKSDEFKKKIGPELSKEYIKLDDMLNKCEDMVNVELCEFVVDYLINNKIIY